jgi:hypothetical protein
MTARIKAGRGLFYSRDSGGKHEMTPGQYVEWACRTSAQYGVSFTGSSEQIAAMIQQGRSQDEDLFFDYCVKGNELSRAGLDAFMRTALQDHSVSHLFIPRRDRFARPNDPLDGVKLENVLRLGGLTLVFIDKVLPPLAKGRRPDMGELIAAICDYNYAGEYRRELAQKMIFAQRRLAELGFSVGGRAPYGFRRWLAHDDGTPERQLADGEHVRMTGHHVVWLPGPDDEVRVIQRVLDMLENTPACRVAAILTAEGVPPPDHTRWRTDHGVRHRTSGVWHQNDSNQYRAASTDSSAYALRTKVDG